MGVPKARHRCQQCGRPDDQVGSISKRGLCESCARHNMKSNILAIQGRDELGYEEWRKRWLDGCGNAGRPITAY